MAIVWNKVTWYSKLLAALFFIFVIPVLTFYIGQEYALTKEALKNQATPTEVVETKEPTGILGKALLEICSENTEECKKPFSGFVIIKGTQGEVITTTKTKENGAFLAMLPPGSYSILPISNEPVPPTDPVIISVSNNKVEEVSILFVPILE